MTHAAHRNHAAHKKHKKFRRNEQKRQDCTFSLRTHYRKRTEIFTGAVLPSATIGISLAKKFEQPAGAFSNSPHHRRSAFSLAKKFELNSLIRHIIEECFPWSSIDSPSVRRLVRLVKFRRIWQRGSAAARMWTWQRKCKCEEVRATKEDECATSTSLCATPRRMPTDTRSMALIAHYLPPIICALSRRNSYPLAPAISHNVT